MAHDHHHDHGTHDHSHHAHDHGRQDHHGHQDQPSTQTEGLYAIGLDLDSRSIERPTPAASRTVETFPSMMRMGILARMALAIFAIIFIWTAAVLVMG
ncbi:hypothetical protein [Oryzibacter oryziterrae]|uniref:hypothetical protein n=1 Tax=Oryzibacter oryziterrae TaxID=2766474 RepID=UPI001F29787E|nr:hypothetical protein [Oryzibacter oryziterrae]